MPAQKKIDKDREKDKSYDFVFVLYPENEAHTLAYLKLTSYQYNALLILHDKDVHPEDVKDDETGELIYKAGDLKKEHYHVYVKFRSVNMASKPMLNICSIGANMLKQVGIYMSLITLRVHSRVLLEKSCQVKIRVCHCSVCISSSRIAESI